ncbi:MAG TPA: hypothetical protein VF777_08925 [Phycisphaerales bacterium]
MQSNVPGLNDPQPLPEPSLLPVLLFEQPWLLLALVLIVALVGSMWQRRAGSFKGAFAWLGAGIAACAGVYLVARAVVTDRERVALATNDLVGATASVNPTRLNELLDESVRLTYFRAAGGLDKTGTIAAVQRELGQTYKVKDWMIQELQVAADGADRMKTQVRVRVTPADWTFPHISWWAIDWKKSGEAWRATSIKPLSIQFMSGTP